VPATPVAAPVPTEAPLPPLPPGRQATALAFVIARKDGVFVLDGNWEPRRLSSTPDAAAPRFLPGRRAVIFLQANRRLMELDLETGAERVVAGPWSTSVNCDGGPAVELALQMDQDVVLDAQRARVCIELMDRNLNMVSCAVSIRVDLAAQKFETRSTLGCGAANSASGFDCGPRWVERAQASSDFPYAFDQGAGVVRSTSGTSFGKFVDWSIHGVSPTGRWVVIRGNTEEADYIHFNLVVVDRLTGVVLPVPNREPDAKTAWPAPLDSGDLANPSRQRLGKRAGDFVGETTVRFAEPDTLVADQLLLLLDLEKIVQLDGELAR
jgi:hypothetical protein